MTKKSVGGVAGDRVGRFVKRHRALFVPAGWISRVVASSQRSSFIGTALGRLRSRLRGAMSADDVLWVLRALEAESFRCWIAGGWGVDALIGKQNRTHDDLDLVVDDYERNEPRARQALFKLGFHHVASQMRRTWMPDLSTFDDGAGHRVELVSINWDRLELALGSARSHHHDEGLTQKVFTEGMINGVVVPCLSVHVQLLYHSGYPLKPTLQHDVTLLESVFGPLKP